ncbi:hypothetical protein M422DRAFT_243663 [Sphaerobolus stellatus SS14]|nr:hypothetical protein M422DRAFT_243663 [Sphaerobolus stellatus SS14]
MPCSNHPKSRPDRRSHMSRSSERHSHTSHSVHNNCTSHSDCSNRTSPSDNSNESADEDFSRILKELSPSTVCRVGTEKNQLRAANKEKEKELADKENSEENMSGKKNKNNSQPFTKADIAEIKKLAAKFTIMSGLWIRNGQHTFCFDCDCDEYEYDPSDRFKDTASKFLGQFHDLLEAIPEKWHGVLKEDSFYSIFNKEMNVQRSNGSTCVHTETGTAILDCKNKDLASAETRFSKFGILIGWKALEGHYDPFCEILDKDYLGCHDRNKIFRSPYLIRTYKALLQGPSSVNGSSARKCLTLDRIWGVESVTPAAIAACAIYVTSVDDSFQPIGARTKIPYFDDFELYLRLITEGLRLKKKFAIGLLEEWNEELYPSALRFIDEDLLEASEQEVEEDSSAGEENEEGDGMAAEREEDEDTMIVEGQFNGSEQLEPIEIWRKATPPTPMEKPRYRPVPHRPVLMQYTNQQERSSSLLPPVSPTRQLSSEDTPVQGHKRKANNVLVSESEDETENMCLEKITVITSATEPRAIRITCATTKATSTTTPAVKSATATKPTLKAIGKKQGKKKN